MGNANSDTQHPSRCRAKLIGLGRLRPAPLTAGVLTGRAGTRRWRHGFTPEPQRAPRLPPGQAIVREQRALKNTLSTSAGKRSRGDLPSEHAAAPLFPWCIEKAVTGNICREKHSERAVHRGSRPVFILEQDVPVARQPVVAAGGASGGIVVAGAGSVAECRSAPCSPLGSGAAAGDSIAADSSIGFSCTCAGSGTGSATAAAGVIGSGTPRVWPTGSGSNCVVRVAG